MNRFKIRLGLPALAVAGVLAVLAALLSGCGAGQVSQMAIQEPAVNGNKVTFNNVALRDIRIQASQTGDYAAAGPDRGPGAGGRQPVGERRRQAGRHHQRHRHGDGQRRRPTARRRDRCSSARRRARRWRRARVGLQHRGGQGDVNLAKPITNGLTYNFTFNFEKAGQATVAVPISAGLASRRSKTKRGNRLSWRGLVVAARYRHGVAKARSQYRCSECRHVTAKWVGRCLECGTWGTVDEVAVLSAVAGRRTRPARSAGSPAVPITSIEPNASRHRPTGVSELDRVLGGGVVPGSVTLLAGDPGVGKSTLLLEVAHRWAQIRPPRAVHLR